MKTLFFPVRTTRTIETFTWGSQTESSGVKNHFIPEWLVGVQSQPNFPDAYFYDETSERDMRRYQRDRDEATKGFIRMEPHFTGQRPDGEGWEAVRSAPSEVWVKEEDFSSLPKGIREEIFSFSLTAGRAEDEEARKRAERVEKARREEKRIAWVTEVIKSVFSDARVSSVGTTSYSVSVDGVYGSIYVPESYKEDRITEAAVRMIEEKKEAAAKKQREKEAAEAARMDLIKSGKVAAVFDSCGEVVQYYELNGRNLNVHQEAMGHLIGQRGVKIQKAQKELNMRINLKPTLSGRLPRKATFKWL